LYDLLGSPGLFKNLDIQPDCYDVLEWAVQFFDVQIVSACSYTTYADKAEWILEKLPFIPISSFSSVKNKYIVQGSVILDDNPENIKYFDGEKIIYTKPWNEDASGYTRADNWKQVKEILQEYLEISAFLDFYQGGN
jgi:5'(3')-deoxyribonucleotidase